MSEYYPKQVHDPKRILKNLGKTGHTVIDLLIARAGVLCVLGLDYSPTIAIARKLATLLERRGRDD